MVQPRLQPVLDWLRRVVTQPQDELTRWQRAARYTYDLGRCGARQLREDRAPQMAAALAFRTLFGLLPVLWIGTMIVKVMGGFDQFRNTLDSVFGAWGLDRFQAMTGNGAGEAAAEEGLMLSEWLMEMLGRLDINLAAVTWVGVGVLIYAAVSLMVTIEGSFNIICRAPGGRPWMRRVPIYWTVLCFTPAAMMATIWLDRRFDLFLEESLGWWWLLKIMPLLWSLVVTWLVMFAVYKLLPNTNVHTRPAIIGALVAAVLLEIGRRTMGAYMANAVSLQLLYGSLGLIPIFMFWVYVMWLVVLFGLEVSATLQMLRGRSLDEIERRPAATGLVDPASVVAVMEAISERFAGAAPTRTEQLGEDTGLPERTLERIVQRLVERGLLHRVEGEVEAVTPSRPPERIGAQELLEIGFELVDDGGESRKSGLLSRLREAQREAASRMALAVAPEPAPDAAGADQGDHAK
jgi:membrane protein